MINVVKVQNRLVFAWIVYDYLAQKQMYTGTFMC